MDFGLQLLFLLLYLLYLMLVIVCAIKRYFIVDGITRQRRVTSPRACWCKTDAKEAFCFGPREPPIHMLYQSGRFICRNSRFFLSFLNRSAHVCMASGLIAIVCSKQICLIFTC